MMNKNDENILTATELRIALSEIYPESTCGAVPVIDRYDAVEAFRAYDDGAMDVVPMALAAYIDHHQHCAA